MTTLVLKLGSAFGLPDLGEAPKIGVVVKTSECEIRCPQTEVAAEGGCVPLNFIVRSPLSAAVTVSLVNGATAAQLASGVLRQITPGPHTISLAPAGAIECTVDLVPLSCGTASVQRVAEAPQAPPASAPSPPTAPVMMRYAEPTPRRDMDTHYFPPQQPVYPPQHFAPYPHYIPTTATPSAQPPYSYNPNTGTLTFNPTYNSTSAPSPSMLPAQHPTPNYPGSYTRGSVKQSAYTSYSPASVRSTPGMPPTALHHARASSAVLAPTSSPGSWVMRNQTMYSPTSSPPVQLPAVQIPPLTRMSNSPTVAQSTPPAAETTADEVPPSTRLVETGRAVVLEEEDDEVPVTTDRYMEPTSRSAVSERVRPLNPAADVVVRSSMKKEEPVTHVRTLSSPPAVYVAPTYWPTINPLLDTLRLIEVMDPVPGHLIKSMTFFYCVASTPKVATISLGTASYSVRKLTEQMQQPYVVFKAPFDINAKLIVHSVDSGDCMEVPMKQLLLSGVIACQGRYQLSDTENIKFRLELGESSSVTAPFVCPGFGSNIEVSLHDPRQISSFDTRAANTERLHKREISADTSKKIPLRTNRHLFNPDGTPIYNRLNVSILKLEGFESKEDNESVFIRACLGSVKAFRCRLDHWKSGEHNELEFAFDFRGNKTVKFSLLTTDTKRVIGTTQMNLGALLGLSKTSFNGSLPVNNPSDGEVCGRMFVSVSFSNVPAAPISPFSALSWIQALTNAKLVRITLKQLKASSFANVQDPLFFRLSCGSIKIKSSKYNVKNSPNLVLSLNDETLELPVDQPLLTAAEQKDFILCIYSRYKNETGCHMASHYIRLPCSIFTIPSHVPRICEFNEVCMHPASDEYSREEFHLSYTVGLH